MRLRDIARVCEGVRTETAGRYNDNEDALNWMIERIPSTSFLQGAVVMIDGFEMLTSQIYRRWTRCCARHTTCARRVCIGSRPTGLPAICHRGKKPVAHAANRAAGGACHRAPAAAISRLARGTGVAVGWHWKEPVCRAAAGVQRRRFRRARVERARRTGSGEACAAQILTLVRDAQVPFPILRWWRPTWHPTARCCSTFVRYGDSVVSG